MLKAVAGVVLAARRENIEKNEEKKCARKREIMVGIRQSRSRYIALQCKPFDDWATTSKQLCGITQEAWKENGSSRFPFTL